MQDDRSVEASQEANSVFSPGNRATRERDSRKVKWKPSRYEGRLRAPFAFLPTVLEADGFVQEDVRSEYLEANFSGGRVGLRVAVGRLNVEREVAAVGLLTLEGEENTVLRLRGVNRLEPNIIALLVRLMDPHVGQVSHDRRKVE